MWRWVVALVVGYLLGSVPVGVLVVRWLRGIDVRQVGSGRTGGTNVLRAAGWGAAVLTGVVDGLKAAVSVLVARWLGGPPLLLALAGVAAVVGHNYSIFLRFRGGAGTMASIGGAAALWPLSGLILIPVLLGVALFTRRASLGSIVGALLLPALFAARAGLGAGPWAYLAHGVLTSALTLWALRPNIRRLLRGEERRIDLEAGRGPQGAL
ncbi:MAG TPA: glycerol-3-phosphate acyltransferase [Anaerolineales bacterium]|nr:glycerol-3-phosphate acyltransferase [Anaerolineae bacterium]HIQ01677.1 glycerol-3-phosphate acyltransferase [Anaerolineales bacterium]